MVSIFLDNASKYTPAGGSVSLNMSIIQNAIEISVADSGMGIDDSEKEKIFRRFYRIDKARSRKHGGTGLGLAIAAWIASEHKGQIQVLSKPGEGSTFRYFSPNYCILKNKSFFATRAPRNTMWHILECSQKEGEFKQ
jgi:two-component system sensor histidine kinase SenX3